MHFMAAYTNGQSCKVNISLNSNRSEDPAREETWPGTNFRTHGNSFCRELNDTPSDSMFFFRRFVGSAVGTCRFGIVSNLPRQGIDAAIQINIRRF